MSVLALALPCASWTGSPARQLCQRHLPPVVALRAQEAGVPAAQDSAASKHVGGRSAGVKKRVRQHVNPLRSSHQQPLQLPDRWPESFFTDASLPLHLDIGCARGLFCLDYAEAHPQVNILGLEIRKPLVDLANDDAKALGRGNVAFLTGNANTHLETICRGCGRGDAPLRSASIQFPDPWFKARHHKRRVVQPDLARSLAENIAPGGWLFIQSDVLEVAEAMREVLREHAAGKLVDARDDFDDWGVAKPEELAHLPTERENSCAELDRPVYRAFFDRV
jgi:tRNA (guanine-N7-)-methyltransferase|eukprot:Transcript_32403.p1 GENE.Transcript_32403~~Transcript_32403.p1  ORF type:complete len:297 (-),score=85.54 Transcript_32403:129-965(-)